MISIFRWNTEQKVGQWLDPQLLLSKPEQFHPNADVLWIDLENPTEEEETFIFQKFFPVHALTFQDITRQRRSPSAEPHFPKVEEFPDYLLVIVNPLSQAFVDCLDHVVTRRRAGADVALNGNGVAEAHEPVLHGQRAITQLSAVLNNKMLITHHRDVVPGIQELRDFLGKHQEMSQRGPDYLFHLVLDAMVDQFGPALDHIHSQLDRIENAVLTKPSPHILRRLIKLKRHITALRKTLTYEREITARLARGEFSWIDEREMVYYRNVYDHIVRFTELIESARETASDLMQTHLAAQSNKLNEVMKVLTMLSTLILPMTLIAGIYGMNFDDMPELRQWWGYPLALGLMLLTGLAGFAFFKWRNWI